MINCTNQTFTLTISVRRASVSAGWSELTGCCWAPLNCNSTPSLPQLDCPQSHNHNHGVQSPVINEPCLHQPDRVVSHFQSGTPCAPIIWFVTPCTHPLITWIELHQIARLQLPHWYKSYILDPGVITSPLWPAAPRDHGSLLFIKNICSILLPHHFICIRYSYWPCSMWADIRFDHVMCVIHFICP